LVRRINIGNSLGAINALPLRVYFYILELEGGETYRKGVIYLKI
tara:strand:- start:3254 stop:3385 length:132 start_codon:yes stop_codon:yes gene_type:complete